MCKVNKSIRMCIVCKQRFFQSDLIRVQCIDGKLVPFCGEGRSFYICMDCIKIDEKRIVKPLLRYCRSDKNVLIDRVKEFKEKIFNG